jgi:2,4-dienoyl-CoA reductase-like NADH-dependent reductase (Old Yellow Enzyme family)
VNRQGVAIGGVDLRSRFGLAPLNTALFAADGSAGPACRRFYQQYGDSGLGVIYVGGAAITMQGRANQNALVLDRPEKSSGLKAVIEDAHRAGVRVIVQLEHAGRQGRSSETTSHLVAPSPVPCPVIREQPLELDREGILGIIRSFANASRIAEEAGADLIEIHAAHGYLLSSFLSSYSNRRTDRYGGSLRNRFRILKEVLYAVLSICSTPIGVRLNHREDVPSGMTLEELQRGLSPLREILSYVSVSAGVYSPRDDIIMPSRALGPAPWRDASKKLRLTLELPTFLAANIDSVALADELLEDGSADVILFGRSLLADPQLIRKGRSEKPGKVRGCTDCGLCKYHSRGRAHIYCPFNPVLRQLGPGSPSGAGVVSGENDLPQAPPG